MIAGKLINRNIMMMHNNIKRSFASKLGKAGTNLPPQIKELTKRKLHKIPNHPLAIISNMVKEYFDTHTISDIQIEGEKFVLESSFDPFVSTKQCFDDVLVPK